MSFGYEYFSGANVVVELRGIGVMECAGLSYSISESKRPIYGYSSRFFDAAARGQVLVQGTILTNYVHEDYVRTILTHAKRPAPTPDAYGVYNRGGEIVDEQGIPVSSAQLLRNMANNWAQEQYVAQDLRNLYWTNPGSGRDRFNPHDVFGGFTIRASFGERSENNSMGRTGFLLDSVYLVGRGKQIQISEDVIVEEHQFFARNSLPIYPEYEVSTVTTKDSNGVETETTTVATPANISDYRNQQDQIVLTRGN